MELPGKEVRRLGCKRLAIRNDMIYDVTCMSTSLDYLGLVLVALISLPYTCTLSCNDI